jgi:LuxR family maltose regulon positive regulatory protein
MAEVQQAAAPAGPRHIIKRPRLTRLLDETSARVILLVAPAGYGKTTLAREWLERRHATWWTATSGSADVAVAAAGVANAAAAIIPGASDPIQEHLRLTDVPARDPTLLGELLARELQPWPDDAWIAIDDYHLLARSTAAEEFLATLVRTATVRLFVTSRVRPRWRTARELLYGKVFELERPHLAMTPAEVKAVFGRPTESVSDLVDAAEGWPAVIGLVAATHDAPLQAAAPTALHDYLAEELFQAAAAPIQTGILQLALVPGAISRDLARIALAGPPDSVLAEAERLGLLNPRVDDSWEIHPLIRTFLYGKIGFGEERTRATAERVARELLGQERWDEAFTVITTADLETLIPELLSVALWPLLLAGRLETLRQWLDHVERGGFSSPVLDLGRAELAARDGQYGQADVFATRALARLVPDDRTTRVEILLLRGRNSILRDHYEESLRFYQEARRLAVRSQDVRAALWGEFVSRRYLEQAEVGSVVAELERVEDATPEGLSPPS